MRGIDFGAKPDGDLQSANSGFRFYDKRSEMWGFMRYWLDAGAMLGDDQDLASELTAIEYNYAPRDGVDGLVIEGREELRKRGLAAVNAADALALSFAYKVAKTDQSWKYGRRSRSTHESEYDPLRYPGVGGVGSTVGEPSRSSTEVFSDDIFGAFRRPRYR